MHTHKVIKINRVEDHYNLRFAWDIEMDCPVQPRKVVVTECHLEVGDEFDPHFENTDVIARFRPNDDGWDDATAFISRA